MSPYYYLMAIMILAAAIIFWIWGRPALKERQAYKDKDAQE